MQAHVDARAAWEAGATEEEMKQPLQHIRSAQWYWDYAAAGHGNAFHAPVETSRIIGLSIDESAKAQLLLARVLASHGKNQPIPYPDIATKEKAQAFIGLDMAKLHAEKAEWIKTVPPEWDKKAMDRQNAWPVQKEKEND